MNVDPVALREIRGLSRRGRTYASRVIYVGLIGALLYYFWSSEVSGMVSFTPSDYARLGHDLFWVFVPLQMALSAIAAASAAAERIAREDQEGTLGLLLLTPLGSTRIARSKWAAALAHAGSLVLCGVPVLAVCVYLGGVGPWDLTWCFATTMALAALAAAFGLRASAIARTVPRAAFLGFAYLLGYTLLPVLLVFAGGWPAFFVSPFVNPVWSVWAIAEARGSARPGMAGSVLEYGWILSTILSFAVAWLLSKPTGRLIEKRAAAPPVLTPATELPEPPRDKAGKAGRPAAVRQVWDHDPLLWKDLETRWGTGVSRDAKRLSAIYTLIFLTLCWLFTQGRNLGMFTFLAASFAALAVAAGASLFASEKEGRRFEMLLSSPITGASVVRSKLLSGLLSLESRAVIGAAFLTTLAWSWWAGAAGAAIHLGVVVLFLGFTYLLSAAASLKSEAVTGALLAATSVLGLILLGAPLAATILDDRMPHLASALSTVNPLWVLRPLYGGGAGGGGESLARFAKFACVYGAACAGLAGGMFWRFDRIMGRV